MICGIDEAGRGCIGGSLFICGVTYPQDLIPTLSHLPIKDSKKLSKNKREEIARILATHPQIYYKLIKKSAEEIDTFGLSQCLKEALEEIMQSLSLKCKISKFIYDGNSTFKAQAPLFIPLETLIRGDSLIHQVSSASILAKYAKDQECKEIDSLYPHYGFLRHSGYCTTLHKEKIKEFGLSPYHRKSFQLNINK